MTKAPPAGRLRHPWSRDSKDKALSRWDGPPQADRLEIPDLVRQESAMLSSYTPYVIEKLTSNREHLLVHVAAPSRRRYERLRWSRPRGPGAH